jgi:hypothetical protein
MSDAMLGALILVPLVVVIYVVARLVTKVGEAFDRRTLAPFAPAIGGVVSGDRAHVSGTHRGYPVRVSFTAAQNVGSGESASQFHAFHVEVLDQPGALDWRVAFRSTSWTSMEKDLFVETADTALGHRIVSAGALDAVGAVSTPSLAYVTVTYEARTQVLTHTDDVSPRDVPTHEHYLRQLDLATHLAAINAQVNPARR